MVDKYSSGSNNYTRHMLNNNNNGNNPLEMASPPLFTRSVLPFSLCIFIWRLFLMNLFAF